METVKDEENIYLHRSRVYDEIQFHFLSDIFIEHNKRDPDSIEEKIIRVIIGNKNVSDIQKIRSKDPLSIKIFFKLIKELRPATIAMIEDMKDVKDIDLEMSKVYYNYRIKNNIIYEILNWTTGNW